MQMFEFIYVIFFHNFSYLATHVHTQTYTDTDTETGVMAIGKIYKEDLPNNIALPSLSCGAPTESRVPRAGPKAHRFIRPSTRISTALLTCVTLKNKAGA